MAREVIGLSQTKLQSPGPVKVRLDEVGNDVTRIRMVSFGTWSLGFEVSAYLVGDIDARSFSDDGRYWIMRGTNLGLESRYLRLEGGKQGRHKFFLEWDELPNYMNNTVVTPFLGVGTNNLTLPSGFSLSTPLSPQNPFAHKTSGSRAI